MPFGATPSRWCVCQFHHFRTGARIPRRGMVIITNTVRRLVVNDGGERFGIEAGAANESAVDFFF
jgi:hypothetical protein